MRRHIQPASPAQEAGLPGQSAERTASPAAQGLRVLLADDEPVSQLLVEAVLARWGIRPALAADGEEAVHMAHFAAFDLVLMDLVMPVLDGVASTRRIRAFSRDSKTSSKVPIIAYSSLDLEHDRALLQRVGLSDVLSKPCNSESLRTCLEQWCPDKFWRY